MLNNLEAGRSGIMEYFGLRKQKPLVELKSEFSMNSWPLMWLRCSLSTSLTLSCQPDSSTLLISLSLFLPLLSISISSLVDFILEETHHDQTNLSLHHDWFSASAPTAASFYNYFLRQMCSGKIQLAHFIFLHQHMPLNWLPLGQEP